MLLSWHSVMGSLGSDYLPRFSSVWLKTECVLIAYVISINWALIGSKIDYYNFIIISNFQTRDK